MATEREQLRARAAELEPWFYDFDLGGGDRIESKLPEAVKLIHTTRRDMMLRAAEAHFGARLPQVSCLDVGCHEGYFSFALAERTHSVTAVDIRTQSLEKAELVRRLKGVENVRFAESDCYDLSAVAPEPYDLVLFYGVLYHLHDPIGGLRSVANATGELCILETQIIDEIEGRAEWGSREWSREYSGVLALIDERAEWQAGNAEAGGFGLSLCPSMRALHTMLSAVGFRDIQVITPPPDGYEQHVRGKRVVIAAAK